MRGFDAVGESDGMEAADCRRDASPGVGRGGCCGVVWVVDAGLAVAGAFVAFRDGGARDLETVEEEDGEGEGRMMAGPEGLNV